jgi:hypothetical protein
MELIEGADLDEYLPELPIATGTAQRGARLDGTRFAA